MARRILLAAAVLLVTALPAAAQSISLTLRDGRVTLITQNATPAAILAEWARQGQVRVVDGERVPGTPLTLQLQDVTEREALDIVLRGAAGYIAAPRAQRSAHLSQFDRVLVMPTSPGASSARAAATTATSRPAMPVTPQPAVVEHDVTQEAEQMAAAPDEEQAVAEQGAAEQPASSTNFDYANPQRYFAARQAEQNAAGAGVGVAPEQPAQAAQGDEPAQPAASPFGVAGATRSTPGMLPSPPQQNGASGNTPVNPYGLPANQSPGSQPAPAGGEPDRAKYINPYAPTPPRP